LQQAIEASVQTDEHRQEVFEMRRIIADELKEEGAKKGARRDASKREIRKLAVAVKDLVVAKLTRKCFGAITMPVMTHSIGD
jgi:hypothetical protein